MRELRNSIATTGLINPITLRATPTGYELIAGRHRLEAIRQLAATHILATIVVADDLHADTIRLTENVARTQLSPVEEACQLHNLVDAHPAGVDGVSATIGRPTGWILDRLDILAWPESLRTHVHNRKISLTAANRLARIQPDPIREERIHQAAAHGINARTAALWLQDSVATQTPPAELSENAAQTAPAAIVTTTQTACYLCSQPTLLEDTTSVRLCTNCITTVANSKQQPPQPQLSTAPPS